MRVPVVSLTARMSLAALILLLVCALAQSVSAKEGAPSSLASHAAGLSDPTIAFASTGSALNDDVPMLADFLSGGTLRLSADVALVDAANSDAVEPVVGPFTVDGLTYAIVDEKQVILVDMSPRTLADGLAGGSTSGMAHASDGVEGDPVSEPAVLAVPESVEHDGAAYAIASIGPHAFAGCDADVVRIPASVDSVDELAFRGSAVAAIEVAEGNHNFSSYDGMLFDADLSSLLLIPEGKQGTVLLPSTTESVSPSVFSHCPLVTQITVEEGSAAFYSENDRLYDATTGELVAAPSAGSTKADQPNAALQRAESATAEGPEQITIYVKETKPPMFDQDVTVSSTLICKKGGSVTVPPTLSAAMKEEIENDYHFSEVGWSFSNTVDSSARVWAGGEQITYSWLVNMGLTVNPVLWHRYEPMITMQFWDYPGTTKLTTSTGSILKPVNLPESLPGHNFSFNCPDGKHMIGWSKTRGNTTGDALIKSGYPNIIPASYVGYNRNLAGKTINLYPHVNASTFTVSYYDYTGEILLGTGTYTTDSTDPLRGMEANIPGTNTPDTQKNTGSYTSGWALKKKSTPTIDYETSANKLLVPKVPNGTRYPYHEEEIKLYQGRIYNEYTIQYKTNGGGILLATQEATCANDVTLKPLGSTWTGQPGGNDGFTAVGYTQISNGFTTPVTKTGLTGNLTAQYDFGQTYTHVAPYDSKNSNWKNTYPEDGSTVTLYLLLKPNKYTIQYWNPVGNWGFGTKTYYYGVDDVKLKGSPNPTNAYEIDAVKPKGWSLDKKQTDVDLAFESEWSYPSVKRSDGTTGPPLDGSEIILYLATEPHVHTIYFRTLTGNGTYETHDIKKVIPEKAKTYLSEEVQKAHGWNRALTLPGVNAALKPDGKHIGWSFGSDWSQDKVDAGASKGYYPTGSALSYDSVPFSEPGGYTLWSIWEPVYTVSFDLGADDAAWKEGKGTDVRISYNDDLALPGPGDASRPGFTLASWELVDDEGSVRVFDAGSTAKQARLVTEAGATVTMTARWSPIIAFDAPLNVEIKVDVLGMVPQENATAALVSRCGAPLKVASIACDPEPEGVSNLFQQEGEVPSISIAVPSATMRAEKAIFPLDRPSMASDPGILSPFVMDGGYGTELWLSYGLMMPDGVSIPMDHPQGMTAVAIVTFTVELAKELEATA